jgi:hypothetical protein
MMTMEENREIDHQEEEEEEEGGSSSLVWL